MKIYGWTLQGIIAIEAGHALTHNFMKLVGYAERPSQTSICREIIAADIPPFYFTVLFRSIFLTNFVRQTDVCGRYG